MASSEEDDYLTMAIPDPSISTRKIETLTEKKKRLAREREVKAHPKSKADLAAEARHNREEGLQRNLLAHSENSGDALKSKGAAMMAKLGYKPGTALGKPAEFTNGNKDERLLEPLGISEREGRGGIGADAEKKRKIREAFQEQEGAEKKRKVDAEEYRERQAREREEARQEGMVWGAMKIAEKLDEEDGEGRDVAGEVVKRQKRRLKDENVLWRGLLKQREVNERDRRMRYDLHQSLSTRADYNDPEEDRDDKLALEKDTEEVDGELDYEDEELNEFEALEVSEKLDRLVKYLREKWSYCFWCKYRYPDEEMEGCPGLTEEDHD